MLDDQTVACREVGGRQYGLDLGDGHLEIPEPADHLGGRNLLSGVVAVAVAGVDLVGLQQPNLVIVAQRLDAQVRRTREVADRDPLPHPPSIDPPPAGGSSRPPALDPPVSGARILAIAPL